MSTTREEEEVEEKQGRVMKITLSKVFVMLNYVMCVTPMSYADYERSAEISMFRQKKKKL